MKDFHVVFPVEGFVKVNERFESLLQTLAARQATIHLVCSVENLPAIYDDSAAMHSQQSQVQKMAMVLKYEMLDRIAQTMQARYPGLLFEYHVDTESLNRQVSKLQDQFDFELLVADQDQLIASAQDGANSTLLHVLTLTTLPVWVVGNATDAEGDTLVAIDMPAHNLQHEHLNRSMVQVAYHLALEKGTDVHLAHCWQLSGQQFMRQWLKLTDIDVARFARVEKQQRESRLLEYIEQADATEAKFHIRVVEGAANIAIPSMCDVQNMRMLVIGHDQSPYGPMGHVTSEMLLSVNCDILVMPLTSEAPFGLMARQDVMPDKGVRHHS
jgi:hypothetical protein